MSDVAESTPTAETAAPVVENKPLPVKKVAAAKPAAAPATKPAPAPNAVATAPKKKAVKKAAASTAAPKKTAKKAADKPAKAAKKKAAKKAAPAAKKTATKKVAKTAGAGRPKKEGLRKPQVRILLALLKSPRALSRAEIAAKAPVDLATCVEYVGSLDDAKREANDVKMGWKSLISLKLVKQGPVESEDARGAYYTLTAAGKAQAEKLKAEGITGK